MSVAEYLLTFSCSCFNICTLSVSNHVLDLTNNSTSIPPIINNQRLDLSKPIPFLYSVLCMYTSHQQLHSTLAMINAIFFVHYFMLYNNVSRVESLKWSLRWSLRGFLTGFLGGSRKCERKRDFRCQ